MSRTVSPAAPLLNPDVWTEIFVRLENRQFGTWSWNDAEVRQQQRELHQLKLVCKQFNDISTSQPELVQGLHLHSNSQQFPTQCHRQFTGLAATEQRFSANVHIKL